MVQPLWELGLVVPGPLMSVFGGGESAEAAVGSPGVVFVPPVFGDLQRLVEEIGPSGDSTSYNCDADGNRDSITDADGNVSRLGYDDSGKVTSTTKGV